VAAIFPDATSLSSARRRQARWEHADAHAERDTVRGGGGERVHRRDRGGADGFDHFPHYPVAAKRSDLHLERVASHSAGTALSQAPARLLSRR
jgi:hypothetical protein